jgi:3-oxoacyl-[acyl-carrier-protein] synthase II
VKTASGAAPDIKSGMLEFTSQVPSSKLRRCSRYNKIAAAAADNAGRDGHIEDNIDKTRVGTIISTGYGASENNIAFSDSVAKGNPAVCSPTVFSGTVPNSCVGQICIINGFKGCSTVLMGGDPLEYSALLLSGGKADVIFCGSVEEYSEELFRSLRSSGILADTEISEGTVIMTVRSEKTDNAYCKAVGFASAALPMYPYVHKLDGSCTADISETVSSLCKDKMPDVIFTSANGTYFDEIEKKALVSVFGEDAVYASPKKLFGETLGSGYMLSTALAAACLKTGRIPDSISEGRTDNVGSILVTGTDTAGNYCCTLTEVC